MEQRKMQGFGWTPDLPDQRDLVFAAPLCSELLPTGINLRESFPPIYEQGNSGDCTASAIAGCIEYDLRREHASEFVPSRLFIYYNQRLIAGNIASDSGANIRDGLKSVNKIGLCAEDSWPYQVGNTNERPPRMCYEEARKDFMLRYRKILPELAQMKACLSIGRPFIIGLTCYESIEKPEVRQSGNIPLPQPGERAIGGHAVIISGYDDARQVFLMRNSWGPTWGEGGYGTIPYAYLLDPHLACDFWTIQTVESSSDAEEREAAQFMADRTERPVRNNQSGTRFMARRGDGDPSGNGGCHLVENYEVQTTNDNGEHQ